MTEYLPPADTSFFLEEGADAITAERTGEYGSAARIYDHGAATRFDGFVVLDVSAITTGGGRTYGVTMEASSSATFASDVNTVWSVSLAAVGQQVIPFTNNIASVNKRYTRIRTIPAGTSPSITLEAWFMPQSGLDDFSLAQLTKFMGVVVAQWENASFDFRAWAGGTVDGGPNSDGLYPLRDAVGNTYLVPCPAKIALSTLSADAIMDLTQYTTTPSPGYTSPQIIGVIGGNLRRFALDLFASRKTRDLEPLATLLSEELLPSYNASTGLERSIAVGEIMRQTLGMVNALHYGVVPDCFATQRTLSMTSGDNVVVSEDPIFSPADVTTPAKSIQVGGAAGSGIALQSTITGYINAYQIEIAHNASATVSNQDGNWGTINTANLQDALDACFNADGGYFNYGSILLMPEGGVLTGCVKYHPRTGILGAGTRQSTFVRWGDAFMCPGGGVWARWDGDTDPYPITQYQDGKYYYPVYPNRYIAPNYYGDYVPDMAPTLANQHGVDIFGTEWSREGTSGGPSPYGYKVDSDFNVFNDFAMDGSRYCTTRLYGGLEFRGGLVTSGNAYHQVDPYPRFRGLDIYNHGWIAFMTFGQCSGNFDDINLMNNGACGWHQRAFDNNIKGGTIIGNAGPGIVSEGGNTNWTTIKVSFNGVGSFGWLWGDVQGRSNLVASAGGDNWNNLRVQESYGPNLFVQGKGNDFTGCHFDDTGCIAPVHNSSTPTWITPAIYVSWGGDDLRLNDVGFGGLVHPGVNYASHAIYWYKDPGDGDMGLRTTGRMYSKPGTAGTITYYQPGSLTGDETPNEWGADDGVAPTGTNLTLDGVDITTL